jgi:hypothetical protein
MGDTEQHCKRSKVLSCSGLFSAIVLMESIRVNSYFESAAIKSPCGSSIDSRSSESSDTFCSSISRLSSSVRH